jgi:hypothetical protein
MGRQLAMQIGQPASRRELLDKSDLLTFYTSVDYIRVKTKKLWLKRGKEQITTVVG